SFESTALSRQIHIQQRTDHLELLAQPGRLAQAPPVLVRDHHDHDLTTIRTLERLPISPVQPVAQSASGLPGRLHLGDIAEIADGGEHDIGQCQGDLLALARGTTIELGSHDPVGNVEPRSNIPGRHRVIHRALVITSDDRETTGRIHRVIDRRGTVVLPAQAEHDEILTMLLEILITQPPTGRQIRDERPRLGDEVGGDLLPLFRLQVERDRTLPLNQRRPVDARTVIADRPPIRIDVPTHRVDANDISTELSERHRAQWGCDESGDLDDLEAGQGCGAGVGHSGAPQLFVITVAAIAVFPPGATACSSCTPGSVSLPTRWICSFANNGDFAVNRYPVTPASGWVDMNASNSSVAVNGPCVTSPG